MSKIRNDFIKQPLDGASVLACAYQLKVRSKNPKDFEYWFRKQLMSKIRNDFIKQHQRERWRYLSLFIRISLLENASERMPNSNKNTSKINRPHDGASVLACASHPKVRSKNSKNFKY